MLWNSQIMLSCSHCTRSKGVGSVELEGMLKAFCSVMAVHENVHSQRGFVPRLSETELALSVFLSDYQIH